MRTLPSKRSPPIGRTLIWCLVCCVSVFPAPAAASQGGPLESEYTVKVADVPGQLFHVTTDPGDHTGSESSTAGAQADLANRYERNLAHYRRVRLPGDGFTSYYAGLTFCRAG